MASIAYCRLGSAQDGYGKTPADGKCFAQWITLCPALNFDVAALMPDRYFQTHAAAPVCAASFRAQLTKRP